MKLEDLIHNAQEGIKFNPNDYDSAVVMKNSQYSIANSLCAIVLILQNAKVEIHEMEASKTVELKMVSSPFEINEPEMMVLEEPENSSKNPL